MSDATIVIETGTKGGSMITAELANSYNKDVFAYPGKVTDSRSTGCNYLIRSNKAMLLTDAQELISMMGWEDTRRSVSHQQGLFVALSKDEQQLAQLLKEKKLCILMSSICTVALVVVLLLQLF